jgi:hypothetical protein
LRLTEIKPAKHCKHVSNPDNPVVLRRVECAADDPDRSIISSGGPEYRCPSHGDIGNATVQWRLPDKDGVIRQTPYFCIACLIDLAKRFCAHT